MDLTTTGVWYFTDTMSATEAAEFAARLESLGYSTLWLPEAMGRDPFAHIAHLANHTTTLGFATGIANIFHRHPGAMRQAAQTLAEQTGGRFLLGIGVSHAPMVEGLRGLDWSKPLGHDADLSRGHGGVADDDPRSPRAAQDGPRRAGPEDAGPVGRTRRRRASRTGPRPTTPPRPARSSDRTSCCWSNRRSV